MCNKQAYTTIVSQVSAHVGQNHESCSSAHGQLPRRTLWYMKRKFNIQPLGQVLHCVYPGMFSFHFQLFHQCSYHSQGSLSRVLPNQGVFFFRILLKRGQTHSSKFLRGGVEANQSQRGVKAPPGPPPPEINPANYFERLVLACTLQ